jgi:hypothetical protein
MKNIQFNVDRRRKDFLAALVERARMVSIWRNDIRRDQETSEEEEFSIIPGEEPNSGTGPSVEPDPSSSGADPSPGVSQRFWEEP